MTAVLCAAGVGSASLVAQSVDGEPDVSALLRRVAIRIEQYFDRAQSVVCDEEVRVIPLGHDSMLTGPVRDLRYELRLAWDEAEPGRLPEASVLRTLRQVNGRDARPGQEPECHDPKSVSPEPLSLFLPGRVDRYEFSFEGWAQVEGRAAATIDFAPRVREEPDVSADQDCISLSLPGWTAGRLWIDTSSADVLRLDERLVSQYDFLVPREAQRGLGRRTLTLERADSSTQYQFVTYESPHETLILPASIDTFVMWRGASPPRLRTIQTYTSCRRFLTDSKIVVPR